MALFLNTARCAWGSGKKYIESGALGGKRSDTHKAAQVGREVVFPAANGLPFIGIGSTSHYGRITFHSLMNCRHQNVEDPFKDTVRHSLHILIKIFAMITLIMAAVFLGVA
ncbi:hypothetical protein ACOSQ4_021602 [Xanthoceras sorbifolium]